MKILKESYWPWLRALAWVSAGIALVVTLHAVFWYGAGRSDFYSHFGQSDRMLGVGELRLYLFMLLLGLPAGACVVRGVRSLPSMGLWEHLVRIGHGLWIPTLFAPLGSVLIAHFVIDYAWFTDDEQAYLLQAKLYAQGRLTMPRIEPHLLLSHNFVVEVLPKDDVPQVTGVYPPLQPFFMALSSLLGHLHISQFFCVGLITYHTGRLAQELFQKEACGPVAAWLCATSPLLLGLGATLHTSILGTTLSLFALRLWILVSSRGGLVPGLALGVVAGSVVLVRPLEGVLVVGVGGSALLGLRLFRRLGSSATVTPGALTAGLGGMVLGGLLPLAALAVVNLELTNHPLHGAYFVLEQRIGRFMGFGMGGMMWGRSHSPELGLVQTITSLVRVNAFAFGWPLSLGLVGLSAFGPFRNRVTLVLLGLSAIHLTAYFFLAFGSVHDFGHAYHVWHLPLIASSTAWVLAQADSFRRSQAESLWGKLHVLVAAMGVAAFTVFWPVQVQRWHDVGEIIWRPIRAAKAATREGQEAVILWTSMQPPGTQRTWVFLPPAPAPDSAILWARDVPSLYGELKKHFPQRAFFRLTWRGEEPVVVSVEL